MMETELRRELLRGGLYMLQFLDLESLFQRPPVPIGKLDRAELETIYPRGNGKARGFTHWLIALLWHEEADSGWKVVVFPVADGTAFWCVPPLFHTEVPAAFQKAWKLSEVIRTCSRNDELTAKFANPYWDDWSSV
jgi:hypothetical protein